MITTLLIVKVTVTLALAFAGLWITRRSRAALRHSLLAASFATIALLPVVSLVAPAINVAAPERPASQPSSLNITTTAVAAASSPQNRISLMLPTWIVGLGLALSPMILGLWKVRALRRSASPWGERFVGGRGVELLLHPSLAGPMTFGLLRPVIILPADAQHWTEDDFDRAIIHELEHVRRGDWLTHCLARSICALYWFHPLAWMAWRRLELEAERSCDDAVLSRYEATAYADQLVTLAQRLSGASKSAQLAMANRADLSARVGAVLDGGQSRGRLGKTVLMVSIAGAAAFVAAISPLRVVAAPQEMSSTKFAANTNLAIIDITVKDENGAPIEGLKPGDFSVTENGIVEHISTFEVKKQPGYYVLGYYATGVKPNGRSRTGGITLKGYPRAKLEYTLFANPPRKVAAAAVARKNNPALLYKVDPEYSVEARKAKYSGTVILSIVVDASGRVERIKVIRSVGLGLDEKAMEAVAKWRFRPATRDGQPIPIQTQVDVDFRIL